MRHSIEVGPYERKMIQNPDKPHDPTAKIIEPLSKMTESNKQRYFLDFKVMNYLLQGIPNDIYILSMLVKLLNKCGNESRKVEDAWEIQRDAQEDNLKTAMITNNRLVLHQYKESSMCYKDGWYILIKNFAYTRNGNKNARRSNRNQIATAGNGMVKQIETNDQIIQRVPQTESNPRKYNVQCYNCNAKGYYAHDCPQPKVRDAKYFREQMLLAMKDEARGNLNEAENDFMLDN
ncbi:putative ribonuclease H-like domain-containing protein [Tanacetum coccineum]